MSASLAEIFENVVDVEHFVPVHQTARPPVIDDITVEGHQLLVSTRQSFSARRAVPVRMTAMGPGLTVTTFGREPWLELWTRHVPLEARRTLVHWTARVRTPHQRSARAAFATAVVNRLGHELGQDNAIWSRRDPRIDRRTAKSLDLVRDWLSTFAADAS